MQIGTVIRKYRKERGLTQEEMARRLGVTAPAVNKWENGNSLPDVAILAPIARLLQVSLDELLGYQEELTQEEITEYVQELDRRLKNHDYTESFAWAKKIMETYPNCLWLIWQFAVILDAQHLLKKEEKSASESEEYETFIVACYKQVLESNEEKLRICAADSLFHYYLRNEQYDKAEICLAYYSEQNPERKLKQGEIYSKTGRTNEAYKAYEELLFSGYQMLNTVFRSLYMLSLDNKDYKKAHYLTDKQSALAALFEMGEYHEKACWMDLPAMQMNDENMQEIAEGLMNCVDTIMDFRKSQLYEHMNFKDVRPEFLEKIRENIKEALLGE